MSDIETVSEGDFATIVEGETVVVEGDVVMVDRDRDGVYVELDESETANIEFWQSEDCSEVLLHRRKDGRRQPITVDDSAELEVVEVK